MAAVASCKTMRGRVFNMSEHFVYRVDGTVGTTVAGCHCDDAIQECVRRVGSLEAWRRTKIVECGIDGLAARDRGDHLRRAVTQAERLHRDQRAVVGQKGDAEVQFEDAVCSYEQPVCASFWHNGSTKARPIEVASV